MNKKALGWIVAGGLLISGQLTAQPLNDLQARLAALHSEEPIRLKVDVDLRHKGAAPLRLNDTRMRGTATVAYGPKGVEIRKKRSWGSTRNGEEIPLVTEAEALDLIDPAATMELLLSEATLVSDEMTTWQGRPARLLVFRPEQLAREQKDEEAPAGPLPPLVFDARIWLDESGVPLAMERSVELLLGPALKATEHQTLTFQQVAGRLLVAEALETYSGTALAVLRTGDTKKMKVTVMK